MLCHNSRCRELHNCDCCHHRCRMLNVWIEVESCEVSGPESMRGEERGELEKAKRGRNREIREQAEKKTTKPTRLSGAAGFVSGHGNHREGVGAIVCSFVSGCPTSLFPAWRVSGSAVGLETMMFCSRSCCSASGILWTQQSGWLRPATRPFRYASRGPPMHALLR